MQRLITCQHLSRQGACDVVCDIRNVKVSSVAEGYLHVTGTVSSPCEEMQIKVVDSTGGIYAEGYATIAPGAATETRTWDANISLARPIHRYSLCKASVKVMVFCVDSTEPCYTSSEIPVQCCPVVSLISASIGNECREGVYLRRKFACLLGIDWPEGFTENLLIDFKLWIENDEATGTNIRTVNVTPPASQVTENNFTNPLWLEAGNTWLGEIVVTLPQRCPRTIPIPAFEVPDCCGQIPLAPINFLKVYDPATVPETLVSADRTGIKCVQGNFAIVEAPASFTDSGGHIVQVGGDIEWYASNFNEPVPVEPAGTRRIKVAVPASGALIQVQAKLGISNCRYDRFALVKRCGAVPCQEVPDDYALIVEDRTGHVVGPNECVNGDNAVVIAPAHEGEVEWIVDGTQATTDQSVTVDPNQPRRIDVSLQSPHTDRTVEAIVGRDECKL
ncbi:MAG: hypothetical protein OIN66_05610, partial [Candidatus Methanoperedens sp.]|nr:hypothetical protein [Candidatus Methanoperedens sp.]